MCPFISLIFSIYCCLSPEFFFFFVGDDVEFDFGILEPPKPNDCYYLSFFRPNDAACGGKYGAGSVFASYGSSSISIVIEIPNFFFFLGDPYSSSVPCSVVYGIIGSFTSFIFSSLLSFLFSAFYETATSC